MILHEKNLYDNCTYNEDFKQKEKESARCLEWSFTLSITKCDTMNHGSQSITVQIRTHFLAYFCKLYFTDEG